MPIEPQQAKSFFLADISYSRFILISSSGLRRRLPIPGRKSYGSSMIGARAHLLSRWSCSSVGPFPPREPSPIFTRRPGPVDLTEREMTEPEGSGWRLSRQRGLFTLKRCSSPRTNVECETSQRPGPTDFGEATEGPDEGSSGRNGCHHM